jgi:hypothetical protein
MCFGYPEVKNDSRPIIHGFKRFAFFDSPGSAGENTFRAYLIEGEHNYE